MFQTTQSCISNSNFPSGVEQKGTGGKQTISGIKCRGKISIRQVSDGKCDQVIENSTAEGSIIQISQGGSQSIKNVVANHGDINMINTSKNGIASGTISDVKCEDGDINITQTSGQASASANGCTAKNINVTAIDGNCDPDHLKMILDLLNHH